MGSKLMENGRELLRLIKLIRRRQDWSLLLSELGLKISYRWTKRLNFGGSYTFIDRSRGTQNLLILLAGYKSYLWPLTLSRVTKFVPSDTDVCVVSSGLYSAPLADLAMSCGWSYLHTKDNKVALVQNLAIAHHPDAKWIYKMDEDIFIPENFFELLMEGYLRIEQENSYNLGFCAPLININGYSYISFLKAIGADGEYRAKFGELKHAASGIKAHSDGEAAKWLWEKSLPFDEVASHFASHSFEYSVVPHRFSIGAILFKRELWETIGGFPVPLKTGGLGMDEEYLCKSCVNLSQVMAVIHNVFVGHFSFFPQEAAMKEYLPEVYSQLSLPELTIKSSCNSAEMASTEPASLE